MSRRRNCCCNRCCNSCCNSCCNQNNNCGYGFNNSGFGNCGYGNGLGFGNNSLLWLLLLTNNRGCF